MRRRAGYPFIAMGISFMVIGFSGRRAFIGIGAAFLVLGFVTLRRRASRVRYALACIANSSKSTL